ncbi:hypothetical protein MG293_017133 [Ovis ammon polii]|uniref:Uncharacterized protein n=1 Tax=Ovis ammon polii TaxID=230172 RepID=A0AAD4TUT8_OVIAM|nr:hypothetical protein MG293_017133 [Ovis ammon polii]
MIWKNMASQVYEMVLTYNVVAAGILDEVMAVLSSTDWDTKFPSPAPSPRHHPWNSTGHTVDIPYLLLVQFHQMDKPVKSKKSLYNSHNFLSPHYREDSGHIAGWQRLSLESSHLTHLTYHTLFHVVFQEEHYKLLSDEGEQKKSYLRLRETQSFYSRNEEEISGQHTELPIGE